MQLLRWIHLVGMVLFIGGGLSAAVVNRMAFEEGADGKSMDWVQWNLGRFSNGGAILLFVSGVVATVLEGYTLDAFQHQGWLLLMIALGIAATAFNGIASQKARELFEKPPSVPSEVSGIRYVIFQLRIGFLIATLGALSTGIWRFTI